MSGDTSCATGRDGEERNGVLDIGNIVKFELVLSLKLLSKFERLGPHLSLVILVKL